VVACNGADKKTESEREITDMSNSKGKSKSDGEPTFEQAEAESYEVFAPDGVNGSGRVDEVNGVGAGLVRDYVPTRDEIRQLAKYWAGYVIDTEFFWWLHGQVSSGEMRKVSFAKLRLERMRKCLGQEEISTIYQEAFEEYGDSLKAKPLKKYISWRGLGQSPTLHFLENKAPV
jgi:hypothetical protein